MNVSYLSFYSQHLNSPKTIFHEIYIFIKLFIVFNILTIIIYCPSYYIYYILIYLLLLSKLFILYYINFLIIIKYFFIYLTYCFFYINNYNNKSFINLRYKKISIFIPFKIKLFCCLKKTYLIKRITCKYFIYVIPEFIGRIISIKSVYFVLIQLLFITTKYESLIIVVLLLLKKIKLLNNTNYNNFNLILSFSFHLLERIIYHFDSFYLSIQLYYTILFISFFNLKLYLTLFITTINNIYKDIYSISSILWSRNIIFTKFFI